MALILNIDTATDSASICLAKDGKEILLLKNDQQKDHAAWLHVAIQKMMQQSKLELPNIDAVAVTIGPGSYTGLRVGLASAKGICYALNKPLITLNTLLVMANAAANVHKVTKDSFGDSFGENAELLCPMIDARRMEVFTAIYKNDISLIKAPAAVVLTENSFEDLLASNTICFFGNGSEKFKNIIKNPAARFSTVLYDAGSMIKLAESIFLKKEFADLAYTEPLYLKEFFTTAR
jgi:tRNA threonylcarbamoyladenosine biosynthesis protein TsaB